MASENKVRKFLASRDWRIWLGLILTVIWMASGIWYVVHVSETQPAQNFSMGPVGSFLEGVFAPLAFLWLVIGLFIQQRELAKNSEVLRKTSEQSEKQTQAIAATEMNARQETFFKIEESVKNQLGGISGMLLVSGLGPVGSGRIDRDQMDEYFSQCCVSQHSGVQALQLQHPEITGHSRLRPPSPTPLPIRWQCKTLTLGGPTTTGFKKQSANLETVNYSLN